MADCFSLRVSQDLPALLGFLNKGAERILDDFGAPEFFAVRTRLESLPPAILDMYLERAKWWRLLIQKVRDVEDEVFQDINLPDPSKTKWMLIKRLSNAFRNQASCGYAMERNRRDLVYSEQMFFSLTEITNVSRRDWRAMSKHKKNMGRCRRSTRSLSKSKVNLDERVAVLFGRLILLEKRYDVSDGHFKALACALDSLVSTFMGYIPDIVDTSDHQLENTIIIDDSDAHVSGGEDFHTGDEDLR